MSGKDTRDILISATLIVLSYPPSPFGFLIYFAFIPQLLLYQRHSPIDALKIGYATGILVNLALLYYLVGYSLMSLSLITMLNASQFAVLGVLQSYFFRKFGTGGNILFPFLWTALEYSRQFSDMAFNWLNIAYSHTYFLSLIQISDITGYLGITFWICLVNTLLFAIWRTTNHTRRKLLLAMIILTGFIALVLYGEIKLQQKPADLLCRVAIVQPNIKTSLKWQPEYREKNLQSLLIYSEELISSGADLVIWPETALPYRLRTEKRHRKILKHFVDQNNISLLTGALDYHIRSGDTLRYNAAILITPVDSVLQTYHKLRLVPWEEGIPFQRYFAALHESRYYRRFLYPGEQPAVLQLVKITGDVAAKSSGSVHNDRKITKFGTVICYESIFPDMVREFFKRESQFLVVITNDEWFGHSPQPYHHIQSAVFRAIENRSAIIQCANNGISGIIDPWGRFVQKTHLYKKQLISGTIPVGNPETIYLIYGDWLGILSIFVTICCMIIALWIKGVKPV